MFERADDGSLVPNERRLPGQSDETKAEPSFANRRLPNVMQLIGIHSRPPILTRLIAAGDLETRERTGSREASQVSSAGLGDGAEGWLGPLATTTASVCRLHAPQYAPARTPVN
jgi:hypothetical protein